MAGTILKNRLRRDHLERGLPRVRLARSHLAGNDFPRRGIVENRRPDELGGAGRRVPAQHELIALPLSAQHGIGLGDGAGKRRDDQQRAGELSK